jgi:hypothetical protein
MEVEGLGDAGWQCNCTNITFYTFDKVNSVPIIKGTGNLKEIYFFTFNERNSFKYFNKDFF